MTAIETSANSTTEPLRLPKKQRPPLLNYALPAIAWASGLMLIFAMLSIIEADSTVDYAKAILLGFSATCVSYGVNRLAIDRGAPQAASGYVGAGLLSTTSILAVGSGLFAATYAGLTLKDTGELMLQEHGHELSVYVSDASGAATIAARVDPVVRAIETDLLEKATCEIESSCVSGRGTGGNGTVARVVADYAGRASSIAKEIAAGDAARSDIVSGLNSSLAAFQAEAADDSKDISERRATLQGIDGRIAQDAGKLSEAVPLALQSAYANELQGGVTIEGRPEAEARLNGILARHGQSLATVLATIKPEMLAKPAFPAKAGVSDTFAYIMHFLPIAAIVAVVELMFPILLWAYTFWSIHWDKHRLQAARDAALASLAPSTIARPEAVSPSPPPNSPRPNGHDDPWLN
jgi:hypothetical protein